MSRIVTGLFATRAEAEVARARLASTDKVQNARVIAQDTAGALVGMPIEAGMLKSLRQALSRGDHVVIATIGHGANASQIVSALTDVGPERAKEDGPKLSYSIGSTAGESSPPHEIRSPPQERAATDAPAAAPVPSPPIAATGSQVDPTPPPRVVRNPATKSPAVDRAQVQPVSAEIPTEEVRIGGQMYRRSDTSGTDVGDGPDFESRAPARRLTDEEVQAGGLLKDRVIEVVEMREEPVISREVVVREEVLIRKTVSERSETVRDTIRHAEAKVEEDPSRR